MKTLIQHVALYQDHKIKEHQNIAITDDKIVGFPSDPLLSAYDQVIDGKDMVVSQALSIRTTILP